MDETPKGLVFGEAQLLPDEGPEEEDGLGPAEPPSGDEPLEASRDALRDDFREIATRVAALPAGACPEDLAAVVGILQPERPDWRRRQRRLLGILDLTVIGSRFLRGHVDRRRGVPAAPRTAIGVLAVAPRARLAAAADEIGRLDLASFGKRLSFLESARAVEPRDRLRTSGSKESDHFEISLHLMPGRDDLFPCQRFEEFAAGLGFRVHGHHRFVVEGLLFTLVDGPRSRLPLLAEFAFLRQISEVAKLRSFKPAATRAAPGEAPPRPGDPSARPAALPKGPALSSDLEVAIMDGGLPAEHPVGPWLKEYVLADPDQGDCEGFPEHGLAAASAFLFGPLPENGEADPPPSPVTVYRILDTATGKDDLFTMFRALDRIRRLAKRGSFVNLSFGPSLAVDDERVHAWTSALDELVLTRDLFLTVAAGNNGEADDPAEARIQVPADAINAVGVGALDAPGPDWRRAPYSAVGPGRRPTAVKPDLSVFGGSDRAPFMVLAPGAEAAARPEDGTSFASPYLLRKAVGLRALCGPSLSKLSVRALLVHYAERRGQALVEVGWGRATEPSEILVGQPGELRLVFQQSLPPGRRLAVRAPWPDGGWSGKATIRATLCLNSAVSAQDPAAYAATALEADFFRNLDAALGGSPAPEPFFDFDGGEPDPGVDPLEVARATVRSNRKELEGGEPLAPGFIVRRAGRSRPPDAPTEFSLVISVILGEPGP